ncbi:MAG: TIGR00282 family metallophosphoesterase [Desulfovibrionaceae bacterium]|nr:TIGR00282 family metallophosphoesterase [Desulfovibrionaceae bacterium]
MRFLMLGDAVGRPGRTIIRNRLTALRKEKEIDAVVLNGENSAGGSGITVKVMNELFDLGVDVITSGNHIWKNREIYAWLEREPRLLRPANYPPAAPGKGLGIYEHSGVRFAVLNLLGRHNLEEVDCPFRGAEALIEGLPSDVKIVLVDFHAETTSEKKALGWFLDGKASAVAGTHTHVQTYDNQILPQGTGYLTDLGMCGVEQSVLGLDPHVVVPRFVNKLPAKFRLAEGPLWMCGAIFDIDEADGRCRTVELVRLGGEV